MMTILNYLGVQELLDPKIDREHALLYLIAKEASLAEVKECIDSSPEAALLVNKPWVKFTLRPLHLAAILGRVDLIDELARRGADINATCSEGWPPLFFTAFSQNPEAEKKLRELGARDDLKSSRYLTFALIKEKVGLTPRQESLTSTFYLDESGAVQPVDASFLQKVGITKYSDTALAFPENYGLLWHEFSAEPLTFIHHSEAYLSKIMAHKVRSEPIPRVCIQKVPQANFLGLTALSEVPKPLTPIGLYAGQILKESPKLVFEQQVLGNLQGQEAYVMRLSDQTKLCVDGKSVGNAMRFINDDFPNLCVLCFNEMEPLICTLEPIMKGEPLGFDYGINQVALKWGGHYQVISEKRLLKFFRKHTPESIYRQILEGFGYFLSLTDSETVPKSLFIQKYAEFNDKRCKLLYTMTTPAALAKVILLGVTSVKQWLSLLEQEDWRVKILQVQRNPKYFIWILSLLYHLMKLEKAPSSMRASLARKFDSLTVIQAIKLLQLASQLQSTDGWNEFLSEQSSLLATYAWQTDRASPLCMLKSGQLDHPDAELKQFIARMGIVQGVLMRKT